MKKSLLSLVLSIMLISAQLLIFSVSSASAADENFESYALGDSILTKSGWAITQNCTEQTGDSAVIAQDPDDASNKVLKITTTSTHKVATAPGYWLNVSDAPGAETVKVSYKVKLDADSHNQYGYGTFHFGTLRVDNSSSSLFEDQFAKWTLYNNASLSNINYTVHTADENGANWNSQRQTPTFNAFGGGWIEITEYIDFSTQTFRAEAKKGGVTVEIPSSYGTNKYVDYDRVTNIIFTARGSEKFDNGDWITDPDHPGILYVDDIKVEREVPLLTAVITPFTLGSTPKFRITTSNPIVTSLSGKLSVLKNSIPVQNSDVTVTTIDASNYMATVYGLQANTDYTLKLASGISDAFGQTIDNDIFLNFKTGTDDDNYVLKNITFSESAYVLNESVVGKDGWGLDWGDADDGSATIVAEPGNPSNRVLKIETVPNAPHGDFTVKINLPDVSSQDSIAKLSYKVKVGADSALLQQYSNHFGTAMVYNSDTNGSTDRFARWMVHGNPANISNQGYGIFGDTGWSNQINTDTLSPLGTWLQIDEYFNFADGTIQATVTDLSSYQEVKIGYQNALYACDRNELYDTIQHLLFQAKPNATATQNAVLYVDDIKLYRISVEPEYRIQKISANYNASNPANKTISTEFFLFVQPENDIQFALAAYDKNTHQLVSVSIETFFVEEMENGYYDIYMNLDNLPNNNVDVYAYLFDGDDSLKPLTAKYAVAFN